MEVSRCFAATNSSIVALDEAAVIVSFRGTRLGTDLNCVLTAMDLPLEQGLRLERRLFQQLFATKDQKEGMLFIHLLSDQYPYTPYDHVVLLFSSPVSHFRDGCIR